MATIKELRNRVTDFLKENVSLAVLVVAALLLELTTIASYSGAEGFMQRTMEHYVKVMMKENSLYIRYQLAQVEVAVNNMVWAVQRDIHHPDSMFLLSRHLVENNPAILGSSITFTPNYYPKKGYWFEPYTRRTDDGGTESMQLGSATHDYTQKEFFTIPVQTGKPHWCEPYLDSDGAQAMVTTYAVPITDNTGKPIATVDADLALDWLDEIIDAEKVYSSSERFLISDGGHLLAGEDNATLKLATDHPEYQAFIQSPKHHQFSENGYVTMTDDKGERLHVFYQPIGGLTGWIMINVCHDKDIFGQLRSTRTFQQFMILAGLLLISFIIFRISRHLEHLRKVNAEKERIGTELRVASQIQQSMLPASQLQQDGIEINGSLVPAREVGGDLFDYFIRNGKLFFCIGDVSGKGAPAALLMAVAHSLFRSGSAHHDNPSQIMQIINEGICQGNESNMFVTLYIGVLDLATGHLLHCNAGHDKPFILSTAVSESGEPLSILESDPNLPAGAISDWVYAVEEYQLTPGSTIFLYTDGLTEAMNSQDEMFGMQRVETVLRGCAQKKMAPKDILDTITLNVHQFVGDAEQSDDLTMLVIRYCDPCG